MNNQDSVTPPEASNPIAISLKESNLAKAQDNDFEIAIMFKDLKENMNKCLTENTRIWKWIFLKKK